MTLVMIDSGDVQTYIDDSLLNTQPINIIEETVSVDTRAFPVVGEPMFINERFDDEDDYFHVMEPS